MSDTAIDQTIAQIALKKNQIKALEAEVDALIAEAGIRSFERGAHRYGNVIVEVSRNARFDASIATERYPIGDNGENMHLYKAQVDSTLAKKFLPPDEYEACQKEFPNNKVEIKVVT